eukprot:gene25989-biopygen12649
MSRGGCSRPESSWNRRTQYNSLHGKLEGSSGILPWWQRTWGEQVPVAKRHPNLLTPSPHQVRVLCPQSNPLKLLSAAEIKRKVSGRSSLEQDPERRGSKHVKFCSPKRSPK